jgi:hypothetical protein
LPSSDLIEERTLYDTSLLKQGLALNGGVLIPNLLTRGCCDLISQSFFGNQQIVFETVETVETNRTASHNAPLSRFVHELIAPFIKSILPEDAKPSYTFTACYKKGSGLQFHVDGRPACTWNVSIIIDSSDNSKVKEWPLILQTQNGLINANLNPGDAFVYSGTRTLHGRPQMPTSLEWVLGMFCHFAPINYQGSLN